MTGFLTPKEAKALSCPVARVHGKGTSAKCEAETCILWRWSPLSSDDPRFSGAIKRECVMLAQSKADETGEKPKPHHLYHKKAVSNVMRDPEAYGVPVAPEKGWCGLGGKPS